MIDILDYFRAKASIFAAINPWISFAFINAVHNVINKLITTTSERFSSLCIRLSEEVDKYRISLENVYITLQGYHFELVCVCICIVSGRKFIQTEKNILCSEVLLFLTIYEWTRRGFGRRTLVMDKSFLNLRVQIPSANVRTWRKRKGKREKYMMWIYIGVCVYIFVTTRT